MENLSIKGTQEFMEKEIPVVLGGFGKDKKCICDKTIAEIHGMEVWNIRARISDNIKRFKENIDFIDLKQRLCEIKTLEKQGVGESHTLELLKNVGYAKQSITQAAHIYLLSERGYAKLIKIMDTDIAWEIHDKLMDEYFVMREMVNSDEQLKAKLLLSIYNGGQNGVLASKKLTEMEVKAATAPLLEDISQKEKVIEQQDNKLQIQKPFVDFAIIVQDAKGTITMDKMAALLSKQGVNIGRNNLYKFLRNEKVLKENNIPYRKYIEAGCFKVVEATKESFYGQETFITPLVTGKGQILIAKKVNEALRRE